MTKLKDLVGQKFGRLEVISRALHYNGRVSWVCICDCGIPKITDSKSLRTGKTASCGCMRISHGQTGSALHKVWVSMRERCNNPRSKSYPHYGGRGITVCKRWDNFELFLKDMGPRPPNHSIERRKNNKGYSPANCYWATTTEQARNTTRTRLLTAGGKTMLMIDWTRQLGGSSALILRRLEHGWTVEEACLTPINKPRCRALNN